jgi:hypothetical protein
MVVLVHRAASSFPHHLSKPTSADGIKHVVGLRLFIGDYRTLSDAAKDTARRGLHLSAKCPAHAAQAGQSIETKAAADLGRKYMRCYISYQVHTVTPPRGR